MIYSPITSIIRKATREKKDKLNILTCVTHESWESGLCKTGHNFYAISGKDVKPWNYNYRKPPNNYHITPNGVFPNVHFDLVLSQHKFGQYQLLKPIANTLNIPLVCIEHTLPFPHWPKGNVDELKKMKGDINVFISRYSAKKWKWEDDECEVIVHGIDTDIFKPLSNNKRPGILTVVNDYVNRNWCCGFDIYKNVTDGLPVIPVGDTKGFSEPAKSLDHLIEYYQTSQVFLNTSTISPVPMSLMEAMSCGLPCVSTATCMIPEIIENGVNGFLSNDEKELKKYLQMCLSDKNLREYLGYNARKTIIEKFGLQQFIDSWNDIFEKAASL